MPLTNPNWREGLVGYNKQRESLGMQPYVPGSSLISKFGSNWLNAMLLGQSPVGNPGGGNNVMPTNPVISTTPGGGNFPDWTKWLPPIWTTGGGANHPGMPTSGTPAQPGGTGGQDWMQWLLPIIAAVGGGLANRSQTAESTSKTTPQYGPEETKYKNSLMQKYMEYLNQDPDLKGYEANQLSQINRGYGERQANLSGDLASRGITGPAAELARANVGNQNFQENTQLRNAVPLLAQNMRGQALTNATGFFNALPYGQNIESTSKQSGNVLGGVTTSLADMLAFMYGINNKRA